MTLHASTKHSQLWGENGELWSPSSRLPDFSHAGYHSGEAPLPSAPAKTSVTNFGAIGDGTTDCTDAFKRAIEQVESGVIEIPAGHYLISDILWIRKSGIVLRGAGPGKTVIAPTKKLEEVRPDMSETTDGLPTSNYSWSGGFLWIEGQRTDLPLTQITSSAVRGDQTLELTDTSQLIVNQFITVVIQDVKDASILKHLYADDPGEGIADLNEFDTTRFVTKITAIDANRITIARPLPFDIRPEWAGKITSYTPTVTECGIENLSVEFPVEAYPGHFKELGMNAIAINDASHCWVRKVHIKNSDSGIFLASNFCTVEDVVLESDRPALNGDTGHHGISFTTNSQDNLLQRFDCRTQFIHDITVENLACGNVIKHGKGRNLSLDHHRLCPHDNLFSQIDVGDASLVWRFGGGNQRGKHTARGATFWSIHSNQDIPHPGPNFGPSEVNFIGLQSAQVKTTELDGLWWETIDPRELLPEEIHAAQLSKRIGKKVESSVHH